MPGSISARCWKESPVLYLILQKKIKRQLFGVFEVHGLLKMHQNTTGITLASRSPDLEEKKRTNLHSWNSLQRHEKACKYPKDMTDFWVWGWGIFPAFFFRGKKNHKPTYFWIKSFPFCPPQKACVTQHSTEVLQCSFNLWRDRVSTSRDRCSNPRKKIKSNAYLCLPLGFIKMNPISVSDPLLKSREALHFGL